MTDETASLASDRAPSRAEELIRKLRLAPHPEGGHYRELFRSADTVQPADGRGPRAALTTIYFLLARGSHSRWHLVSSDEVWHLYEGGPLEILEMPADATEMAAHRLAPVGDEGGAPVHTVRAGRWQAARPLGDYALVGCNVGPGFDFADFRMLSDDAALAAAVRGRWPDLTALV